MAAFSQQPHSSELQLLRKKKKRITAPPLCTQSYCPSLLLAFIANIHAMYFTYLPFIVYLSVLKLLQQKQKRVDSLWYIPAKHVCKS